jgi:hypothetical protein
MDPQPAGPQSKNMRTQEQILDRRRAILEQVTELLVMRCLQVTAYDNAQRSGPDHFPDQFIGRLEHAPPNLCTGPFLGIGGTGRRKPATDRLLNLPGR